MLAFSSPSGVKMGVSSWAEFLLGFNNVGCETEAEEERAIDTGRLIPQVPRCSGPGTIQLRAAQLDAY